MLVDVEGMKRGLLLIIVLLRYNSYAINSSTFFILTENMFSLLLEGEEGREREKEKVMDVREKHCLAAFSYPPDQGRNLQPGDLP